MMAISVDPDFQQKKELRIKDLADQPLIIYRRFEDIFNQTFAHHGLKPFMRLSVMIHGQQLLGPREKWE